MIVRYCVVMLLCGITYAQVVQWASEVIDFSSQMDIKQFSAKQALGEPNSLPQQDGLSPCAWLPSSKDSEEEYLWVGFKKPMRIRQIAIAENCNPSAVYLVEVFDTENKKHVVYRAIPEKLPVKGRMLNIFLPSLTPYKVKSVRVWLDCKAVKGWNQIDAIGISPSTDTIKAQINFIPGLGLVFAEPLEAINSPYDELGPVISFDGEVLYFTRNNHPENMGPKKKQDIWYAKRKPDGSFEPPKNLGPPINNEGHNYICSITPDGNTMLLANIYLPNGEMKKGVSLSHRTEKGWSFPKPLKIKNFYNKHKFGEYFLSASGRILLLCIERDDSYGSKDIYVSFLQENGTWSEPKNLGPIVNTAHKEISPFLAADERTLYYSTAGLSGFGRSDMFMTRRLDDTWTNWTKPINLGPMINSKGWDAYYSIPASGEYAYFVTQTEHNRSDIFRIKLPPELRPQPVCIVEGIVKDSVSQKPLSVKVYYESLTQGKQLGYAYSNPEDGRYKIILPAGDLYGFLAVKEGYVSVSQFLDLRNLKKFKTIHQDLSLIPIEKAKRVRLNNIFFESGKAELKMESTAELQRLVALLKKYPNYRILLEGHTDDVGDEDYNMDLSIRRAKAVRDYLVKHGIDPSRITYKGYGETRPLVPNDSEAHRAINRRVEYTVIIEEE